MIPGFVQWCFFSSEHEAGRWRRKCFYSFNLPSRILDCLFGWCASVAKCSPCCVNKNVVPGSFCEPLRLRFQESDVSQEKNGDKEQNRWALFEHEEMIGAIDWGREAKKKRRFPMTLGIDLRPVIPCS